jgi:hypothetical protein
MSIKTNDEPADPCFERMEPVITHAIERIAGGVPVVNAITVMPFISLSLSSVHSAKRGTARDLTRACGHTVTELYAVAR